MGLFKRKGKLLPEAEGEESIKSEVLMNQMHPMGSSQPKVEESYTGASQPIGAQQVKKAYQTWMDYKNGKKNLEQKIIENEQWYQLRHWDCIRKQEKQEVEPTSAWLFNCIANKHADAMDNFPSPNLLPREEADQEEATMLSSVVPAILEQSGFEEVYAEVWDSKLRGGTGVYGIFWDPQAMNGMGEIVVREVDVLNLFWEPGISDIQKSRNLFHVELWNNDLLEEQYPQLAGKLGGGGSEIAQYVYDDKIDTSKKTPVVDWYYRKNQEDRQVLHYVKFVGEEVLFASENEAGYVDSGWYQHGKYPFVFDPLFRMKGSPCGFGYIDVAKSAQEYIDRGGQAIMKNMLANAAPRHFVRNDGSVNEKEYADLSKDFVHVDGNLGQDSIMPIQGKALNGIYVSVIKDKVDELKETTGNRDIATGGTSSGVTAASAIAAMQEAGSKLSRDHIKASYRAHRKLVELVVELIRQFWDLPRCFRITGEQGKEKFVTYSNGGIQPQHQGVEMGVDMGYRVPLFDIQITAQRENPYSRMSQNELAMQFFGAGFFNPQMADQALAALEMMDFDRKEFIMQRISQNGGLYQEMMAMRQQLAALSSIVGGIPGAMGVAGQMRDTPPPSTGQAVPKLQEESQESGITRNARQRVAESTAPK